MDNTNSNVPAASPHIPTGATPEGPLFSTHSDISSHSNFGERTLTSIPHSPGNSYATTSARLITQPQTKPAVVPGPYGVQHANGHANFSRPSSSRGVQHPAQLPITIPAPTELVFRRKGIERRVASNGAVSIRSFKSLTRKEGRYHFRAEKESDLNQTHRMTEASLALLRRMEDELTAREERRATMMLDTERRVSSMSLHRQLERLNEKDAVRSGSGTESFDKERLGRPTEKEQRGWLASLRRWLMP